MLELQCFGQTWLVLDEKSLVAELHLDYSHQVKLVVLNDGASDGTHLKALQLAISHGLQYVKDRSFLVQGGVLAYTRKNTSLTSTDSHRLMDFSAIPDEITKLGREKIVKDLQRLSVEVITAIHSTAEDAIQNVVSRIGIETLGFWLMPEPPLFDKHLWVEFSAKKSGKFTFWKAQSKPLKDCELHIVPAYHPVMNECKSIGIVNGSTDAYVGGKAVRTVQCPKEARAKVPGRNILGGTFHHVIHPYHAIGDTVSVGIEPTRVRSKEGVEELEAFLRGALNLDNKYVSISGGFNAPLRCAHNRLLDLKRPSPWPKANVMGNGIIARGSEEHCVWAHRVLTKEGVLRDSYVPSWFIKEGWLEIYKDAQMQHGLF